MDFTRFKQIEISDRERFWNFSGQYYPYSDFNFTSLWSYDVNRQARYSIQNGNLYLKFCDYMSGAGFWTYLGHSDPAGSIRALLSQSKQEGLGPALKLVPEISLPRSGSSGEIEIVEDADNHDYILSSRDLLTMSGSRLRGKRNFLNRFIRNNRGAVSVRLLKLSDPGVKKAILELFSVWQKGRGKTDDEVRVEYQAVSKLFELSGHVPIEIVSVFLGDELVGFSIDEKVGDHYFIHFEKAKPDVVGIFEFLKTQSSRRALERGCEWINYEQDLGMEGLRRAKRSYAPVRYLRKYLVRPRSE